MMKDPAGRADPGDLDDRAGEILKSVIQAHVITGEPVGSRSVSRAAGLDLSPATIRNVMSDLEERGLLSQPHASAGRVPTDLAYRLYVDRLMSRPPIDVSHAHAIDEALLHHRGEIPELLGEAARQLSRVSQHVGVVLVPDMRRIVVEHLEFVRLDGQRVVAILVDRAGVVHNRILDLEAAFEQPDLDRVANELSRRFSGQTLPTIREAIARELLEEQSAYDRRRARLLELGRDALAVDGEASDVLVEGASNLVGALDFDDLERTKELLRTLEQKGRLVDLLEHVLTGQGVQVVIGHENPVSSLSDLSVVATTYRAGDRVMGTVGIVGPTRMEYARAIALVDYLAHVLTRFLTNPGA
jgi:heat-inducible transcriptional repressor